MKVMITIRPEVVGLLKTLSDTGDVKQVVNQLIDHAQQGVYRPGAWERDWVCHAFGYDWIRKLEADPQHPAIFQRPRRAA